MINKITIKKSIKIVNDEYVIKRKNKTDIANIYNYLLSRSFSYFPKILKEDDEYIYYEYIKDIEEPLEQKAVDLINLVSLLHNKTTFYKEVDLDNYKYIYESIHNEIDERYKYYSELMNKIDNEVYMSPANYLIARNISNIYGALNYAKNNLDEWYKMVDNSNRVRVVLLHNNLSLDHYLKSDKPYLISFDKAKIGMPIFDMISFYQKHYLDLEFLDLFKIYLSHYPYSDSELKLFLTIISIPKVIDDTNSEYQKVMKARRVIDYIYKTGDLVAEYSVKKQANKT